ncbi:hypothetical protein GCM10009037_07130 [Halarchaeum grantii]|uniref:Uncharacterized protein n=1 Tax=Halarchaeum grantii TaxID=1193105 RepID=A0A830F6Z5_9EURY|nr:hypothetical protein [Halarchaeum grantii]GGL26088.1 hypothetical protein GCM10009037_07130 [Halarchaeum grantii]
MVDPGDVTPNGGNESDGGNVLPSWLTDNAGTLKDFAKNPAGFLRKFIIGSFIAGLGWLLRPIFDAIQLVFLGSEPSTFAAPGEVLGLADLPVALAGLFGDAVGSTVRVALEAVASIIGSVVPQGSGPLGGLVLTVVFVVLAVAAVRIGVPLLRAGLEAVPVVGGPLSTLLGKL